MLVQKQKITEKSEKKQGKIDVGLCFAVGLFFLTLALSVAYVSHFGLKPLSKEKNSKVKELSAVGATFFPLSGGKTPVKEIFIGSYGAIDPDILREIQNRLEQSFGVKTMLLNPSIAIPEAEPFYDVNRHQYDADALRREVERSSTAYGQSVRFVYFADVDMASFSESPATAPTSSWFQAQKGSNAVFISLFNLRDGMRDEASRENLIDRSEIIAMRAIGITVGFEDLSFASDASCVMYPATILAEIDAQKRGERVGWCASESEAVRRVFQE